MRKKTLGEKIVYLRGIKDMSQESLAKKLNVRVATISRWENNHNSPSFPMLIRLANILEIKMDDLK